MQQNLAQMIYKAGNELLKDASESADEYEFSNEAERLNYANKYQDFKNTLEKHKESRVDSASSLGVLISIIALFTSLAYIFAGVTVFKMTKGVGRYLKWGMGGVLCHYVLIIFDYLISFVPFNKKIMALLGVFEISGSLFEGWILPVGLFSLFMMAFAITIYLILPKVFMKRLNIDT